MECLLLQKPRVGGLLGDLLRSSCSIAEMCAYKSNHLGVINQEVVSQFSLNPVMRRKIAVHYPRK